MSKLMELWNGYLDNPKPRGRVAMEIAITEAEETIARLTRERDEARAETDRLAVSFRVNMLRYGSGWSHDEITAEIERVRKGDTP